MKTPWTNDPIEIYASKEKEMEAGKYYWISKMDGSDKCLVYCYVNPDFSDGKQLGIGFNISDGAAWIPLWDLPKDTLVKELKDLGI